MCIAIYKPADKRISKSVLKICYDNNNDGAGFAYINTSHTGVRKLVIKKYMDFEPFWKQYDRAQTIAPDSPFIIHFRIGTHGVKTSYNCHPFYINKETAFIHNGVITGVGNCKTKSDTQLFNDLILKKLPIGWEYNSAIVKLIEDFIGFSKIVTLNINGESAILNEAKGVWDDGVWYSNNTYKVNKSYGIVVYNTSGRKNNRYRSQYSFEGCEYCNIACQIMDMVLYCVDGSPIASCKKCSRDLEDLNVLRFSDRVSVAKYLSLEDKSMTRSYGGYRDDSYGEGWM